MSKSWFYLGIISSLAILTSSCGGDGDNKAAVPAPNPSTATSPAPAPAAPTSTATNPTPATTPSTAAIKPISADVSAGLIPPTDPENWSRTVAKGRPDPFAMLALQPVEVAILTNASQQPQVSARIAKKSGMIQPIPTQTSNKTVAIKSGVDKPLPKIEISTQTSSKTAEIKPGVDTLPKIQISTKLPNTSTTLNNPKIAKASSTPKGTPSIRDNKSPISSTPKSGVNKSLPKITVARTTKSTQSTVTPKSKIDNQIRVAKSLKPTSSKKSIVEVPAKTKIATKPEPVAAKPLQAMAIEISGMIDVAGKTQVIIKLPTESFSRYIEVGERIANGKVLVKRVEGQNSLSPTVILEEVGVEVSRKIGEKLTPSTPEATPKP